MLPTLQSVNEIPGVNYSLKVYLCLCLNSYIGYFLKYICFHVATHSFYKLHLPFSCQNSNLYSGIRGSYY